MKRIIRDTSIDAYHRYVTGFKQKKQYEAILDIMGNSRRDDWTAREIEDALDKQGTPMRGSSLSGRISELKKNHILVELGKRQCYITGIYKISFTLAEGEGWREEQDNLNKRAEEWYDQLDKINNISPSDKLTVEWFKLLQTPEYKDWVKTGIELGLTDKNGRLITPMRKE